MMGGFIILNGLDVLPGKDFKCKLFTDDFITYSNDLTERINEAVDLLQLNVVKKLECSGGGYRFIPVHQVFQNHIEQSNISHTNCLNAEECFAEGGAYWGLSQRGMLVDKYTFSYIIFQFLIYFDYMIFDLFKEGDK